jgi:CDP-diacylglycerol---glycerol-3-phosphate 3-phosphatidyltransferase
MELRLLKGKVLGLGVVTASLTLTAGITLGSLIDLSNAIRWLLGTWLGAALLFGYLWLHLNDNHRQGDSDMLPSFGSGNSLTIIRGILLACLAGFLMIPRLPGWFVWIPGIIFLTAISADYFDGYLARRQNMVTALGELLDIQLDGAAILIGVMLAIHYDQVPLWYLPVGLARYLYLGGMWLNSRRGKEIVSLAESSRRRGFAGAQMVFLGVLLLPIFHPPATFYTAAVFMGVFLSGFLYDWFLVTGIMGGSDVLFDRSGIKLLIRLVPLGLRITVAVLLLAIFLSQSSQAGNRIISSLSLLRGSPDAGWAFLAGLMVIILAILLVLGVMGRLAAILILIFAGLVQIGTQINPLLSILILAASLILFTGTGPISIWSPEARIASHKAGQTPMSLEDR